MRLAVQNLARASCRCTDPGPTGLYKQRNGVKLVCCSTEPTVWIQALCSVCDRVHHTFICAPGAYQPAHIHKQALSPTVTYPGLHLRVVSSSGSSHLSLYCSAARSLTGLAAPTSIHPSNVMRIMKSACLLVLGLLAVHDCAAMPRQGTHLLPWHSRARARAMKVIISSDQTHIQRHANILTMLSGRMMHQATATASAVATANGGSASASSDSTAVSNGAPASSTVSTVATANGGKAEAAQTATAYNTNKTASQVSLTSSSG